MEFRNNITNINDLHVGEVYMDAQTRQLYVVTEEGTHTQLLSDFDLKLVEEGFRNFDSKIDGEILSSEEPEAIWTLKFGRIG